MSTADEIAEIAELIRTRSPTLKQPPGWARFDAVEKSELDFGGDLHPTDPVMAARIHLRAWELVAQNEEYVASRAAMRAAVRELSMEEFDGIRDIVRRKATLLAEWTWGQYDGDEGVGIGLAETGRKHAMNAYLALRERGYDAILIGGIEVGGLGDPGGTKQGVVLRGLALPTGVRDRPA